MKKLFFNKIIFVKDYMNGIYDFENYRNIKDDYDVELLLEEFEKFNIKFNEMYITCMQKHITDECDLIVYDWGGACIGNSLLQYGLRIIIENAQQNFNKKFLIFSTFTQEEFYQIIQKEIDSCNTEKYPNIYCGIKELIEKY